MRNKGCNACDNYLIGAINLYGKDTPHSCKIGKNKEFDNWWKENGNRDSRSELTVMPCFKETKLGELTNNLHEALEELRKINLQ